MDRASYTDYFAASYTDYFAASYTDYFADQFYGEEWGQVYQWPVPRYDVIDYAAGHTAAVAYHIHQLV